MNRAAKTRGQTGRPGRQTDGPTDDDPRPAQAPTHLQWLQAKRRGPPWPPPPLPPPPPCGGAAAPSVAMAGLVRRLVGSCLRVEGGAGKRCGGDSDLGEAREPRREISQEPRSPSSSGPSTTGAACLGSTEGAKLHPRTCWLLRIIAYPRSVVCCAPLYPTGSVGLCLEFEFETCGGKHARSLGAADRLRMSAWGARQPSGRMATHRFIVPVCKTNIDCFFRMDGVV